MSVHDMILTAILVQAYYIGEKKASFFESSIGSEQIEVEASH